MKLYKTIIIGISALGLCFVQSHAQNNKNDNKSLYNEDVIVNLSYNPIVTDAIKLTQNPSIFDTNYSKIQLQFNRLDKGFHTMLKFDTIKPAKVKGEPLPTLYNTHIKAGIGTYLTPILQVSYASTRDKSFLYGIDFSHRSSLWGGIKDYGHSTYANNDLNLFAKKIFNHYSLTSRAYYNFSRNYYYGSKLYDVYKIDKKDYRVTYHNVGFDVAYTSLERDNSFQHNAMFSINNTSTKIGNKELDLKAMIDISKSLHLFSTSDQILGLTFDYREAFCKFSPKLDASYLRFYDTNIFIDPNLNWKKFTNTRALFNFSPYLIFDMNKFHFFASMGIVPKHNGYNKFQILPTATVSFEIIPQVLSLYGGLKSTAVLPTMNDIRIENPYITPSSLLQDEMNENLFGKVFLNIASNALVSLEAGYESQKNHHFFTATTAPNAFNLSNVVYSDAKRYYATFEADYSFENSFKINTNVTYQKVTTTDIDKPWYTPNLIAKVQAKYSWQDKLDVSITPTFKSKSKAIYCGLQKDIKAMVDVNLNASYQYNTQWKFFVDLENLAYQRYYQYYDYPSQRIVAIIGAVFAF